ncbi:MAG: hypothetical protein ISP41_06260 [Alphaproteobacteria bacterium]|nr:hypothetical protein [Alphaproteobacteria bacterium]
MKKIQFLIAVRPPSSSIVGRNLLIEWSSRRPSTIRSSPGVQKIARRIGYFLATSMEWSIYFICCAIFCMGKVMIGGYAPKVRVMLERGGFRCHRFVAEGYISRPDLARHAGLANGTLKGIEASDFFPSVKTLHALESVIPVDYQLYPIALNGELIDVSHYVEGRRFASSGRLESEKCYLDREAVDRIDGSQMAKIRRAAEQLSGRDGAVPEKQFDRLVFKSLAPEAAVHVVDVTDPRPEGFVYEVWDSTTGWRDSQDLTGYRVSDASDTVLMDCTFEDFKACRDLRWPNFAAISRKFSNGKERQFLRYLHPISGSHGSLKVLCICRPKEFHT